MLSAGKDWAVRRARHMVRFQTGGALLWVCTLCEGRVVMGALAAFVTRFAVLLDVAKFPAFEALQGTRDEFFYRESLVRYYH